MNGVIPDPVLSHALKQVQGLTNSGSIDFGISERVIHSLDASKMALTF
jgi:hypothetical protein